MPEPENIQEYDLLLIEDARDVAELTLFYLNHCNCLSLLATNLSEARDLLAKYRFRAALVDQQLPDGDGAAFIQELKDRYNIPHAIATSAARGPKARESSKIAGADRFLSKPYGLREIRECLEEIFSLEVQIKDSSSAQTHKTSGGDLDSFRSAGDIALAKRNSAELIRVAHQMANESFALQLRPAAIAFSETEEAAREKNWIKADRSWSAGWLQFDKAF